MHLAVQLAHQRFVHPGPLVLGTALLKFPARTEDRDRTVSRRSEPSSLPIGDQTLSAKEIIANESQERMGLLIDESAIEHVQKIADREHKK